MAKAWWCAATVGGGAVFFRFPGVSCTAGSSAGGVGADGEGGEDLLRDAGEEAEEDGVRVGHHVFVRGDGDFGHFGAIGRRSAGA